MTMRELKANVKDLTEWSKMLQKDIQEGYLEDAQLDIDSIERILSDIKDAIEDRLY